MRYALIAAFALAALAGGGTAAPPTQPLAVCAAGQAPVCAVRAGQRQSYWNACAARQDDAIVILAGECPCPPNSGGGN
jgi:hypothetical protein